MIIAIADIKDLQQILDLQYLAYQSEAKLCNNPNIPPLTQTLEDLEGECKKGTFLKALDNEGGIVGSVRAYSEGETLHIGKLIVAPKLQGQGVGTKLLQEVERLFPHSRYELFTSSKSERNIKLYERLGYRRFDEQQASEGLTFVYLHKVVE